MWKVYDVGQMMDNRLLHKLTFCLFVFVCFDSLRPINNLSAKQGRVLLGWTSTKLG